MTRSTPAQAVQRLVRMSPVIVPLCVIGLLISLWFGPHSIIFMLGAIISALLYTAFWLLYWKYHAEDAGAIFFWLLAAMAIGPGYLIARNLAFGNLYGKNDLWSGLQFAAIFTLVFAGIVLVFRTRIRGMTAQIHGRLL